MVNVKTAKCVNCGGVVIKFAGQLSKICYDICLKCREKAATLKDTDNPEAG